MVKRKYPKLLKLVSDSWLASCWHCSNNTRLAIKYPNNEETWICTSCVRNRKIIPQTRVKFLEKTLLKHGEVIHGR